MSVTSNEGSTEQILGNKGSLNIKIFTKTKKVPCPKKTTQIKKVPKNNTNNDFISTIRLFLPLRESGY